jgi:hypothetical protein
VSSLKKVKEEALVAPEVPAELAQAALDCLQNLLLFFAP